MRLSRYGWYCAAKLKQIRSTRDTLRIDALQRVALSKILQASILQERSHTGFIEFADMTTKIAFASSARSAFCLVALCLTTAAQAMTFTLSPPVLYLGGPVVGSDWDAWEEAMKRFGAEIKIVALHDSGGGDSLAGRRIGNDIRKRNLQTVVHGRCSSACANMFLGGKERQ